MQVSNNSDRNFGFVFAVAFAVLGLGPVFAKAQARVTALVLAGLFFVVASFRPALLQPLNKTWTMLSVLLGRVIHPMITAVLFFLVFTPAGLFSRMLGKDPLRLKSMPEANTYWIVRNPPGPEPETMAKQF